MSNCLCDCELYCYAGTVQSEGTASCFGFYISVDL